MRDRSMRLAVEEIAGQQYAHERRNHRADHHRQFSIMRSTFRHGSRHPHCAEAIACGITFAGTTIQRKIHSRIVSQVECARR